MKPEQLKYSILKKAFSGQLITVESDSEKPRVKAVEYEETPFDIPDEWFWSDLGSCCEMYTGNSISESVKKAKYAGLKEGYDYIATKDVAFEHTIEYDNGVRIPVDEGFRIAYSGSVLMCIEGGSAGRKIGILDRDVCFGNKLCTFNSKEIVNSYIYYYLQSHEFKAFFMDNMSGIIGGVSIKKLKALPIPVPTVSEQKAIVAKIEELLPYVDRYAESYEKLELFNAKFPDDMKKSILQYAIQGKLVEQRSEEGTAEELYQQIQNKKKKLICEGKKKEKKFAKIIEDDIPFDIPETWKWVRLASLCKSITDGDHQPPPQTDTGYPFLVISNLSEGKLSFSNTRHVNEEYFKSLSEDRVAENGDLLFTVTGSYGIVVKVDTDEKFCFQRHIALLKLLSEREYLYYALQSPLIKRQCDELATGIAQKTVGLNTLRNLMVPLPPVEEQKRIVKKIEELLPYCEKL